MRFLHIADLHFGKSLHDCSLVEEDQPFWVERFMELVKSRQEAGVSVTVITLDPDAEGYENTIERHILIDEMKNNGIYVRTTEDESEHYAVIDHEIVWHGGINLLGKEDAWDNLIRVRNRQAAAELLEISYQLL